MTTKTLLAAERIPAPVLAALDSGDMSLRTAAERLGLHRNALHRRIALMIRAGLAPDSLLRHRCIAAHYDAAPLVSTPDTAGTHAAQLQTLRRQLHEMTARARAAEERLTAQDSLADVLAGLAAAPVETPAWVTSMEHDYIPYIRNTSPSVPILVLTDWHLGETVDPAQSGGYRYNVAIAEDRIRRTVDKTIHLTRDAFAGLHYPGIICALGGDLVSGSIHGELADTDELSILRSIMRARDLACAAITALADEFGRVYVPTAVGNHGRIFDRKPRAKGYSERNADWLIYQLVADHFRYDDRVTVSVPTSGETIFSVYGRQILLTHGDQLGAKGGDGIIGAIGPVMRGSLKTIKHVASLGHDIDHLIIGHWHQQIHLPAVTVCGSSKGPDEYSTRLLRAPVEDPSQTLMLIHPEHGITIRMPINLRDEHCPKRNQKASDWVAVFDAAA